MMVNMLHVQNKPILSTPSPLPAKIREKQKQEKKFNQDQDNFLFVFFATSVFFHSEEIFKQLVFFSLVGIHK